MVENGACRIINASELLPHDVVEVRLAKAQQEEIKLRKMRGETGDLKAVQRRSFALGRLVRDRQDAWVSRAAPLIAAELGTEEGRTWRAIKRQMTALQAELAALDLDKALATDPAEEG